MTQQQHDELTGIETTGHEWDGIRELNNPLPKWWLYLLYASIAAAVIYSFFVPPIPQVEGLQPTARATLREDLAAARAVQAVYLDRIAALGLAEIRADGELLTVSMAGGGVAFAENCAACHGQGGAGAPGFPSLADDSWTWGGTLDEIHESIRYGIRSDHDRTRWSEMPAFGRDGILTAAEISDTAHYVLQLSGPAEDAEAAARGRELYAENCAICHGDRGEGDRLQGAPALNDRVWIYGSSHAEIETQIRQPRHGVMPAWVGRLDETTIKMLAVYVHTLGGGE